MNNIDISSESTKFVTVGFDVHKNTISACVLDQGDVLLERFSPTVSNPSRSSSN